MSATIEIIDIQTGKVLSAVAKDTALALPKGQALLDPETQEYDARRQLVRAKTLPRSPDPMEFRMQQQDRRIEALERQLATILSRTSVQQVRGE